jgi:hypothetical protein
MSWRILALVGIAGLCASRATAGIAESEYVWTLRQQSEQGQLRTCSLIRFSEDRDGAEGALLAGEIDGIGGEYVGDWGPLDPQEEDRPRRNRRYMDEIPGDVTWLQVSCTLQQADGGPSGMSCKGTPGILGQPSTSEFSIVTFSAKGKVTRRKFSGLWRGEAGSQTGSFTMELGGGRCSATQEWWMDGKPLWRKPRATYDARLRARLRRPATVADLLLLVGPGYMLSQSSTGTVFWDFSDGHALCTSGYPRSLNTWVYKAW